MYFILNGMTKYYDCHTFYLLLSFGSAIISYGVIMKLHKETYYWIQIRHETRGWIWATASEGGLLESHIPSKAKIDKQWAEDTYQCKARIVKVIYREEVFKEKGKSI